MQKQKTNLSAEAIIEKHIEAIGGKEKLLDVHDITTIMKSSSEDIDFTLTISQKAPNKLYQYLDGGELQEKIIFNGEEGKTIIGVQQWELTGEFLDYMKLQSVLNLFLFFNDYNIQQRFAGIEKINGRETYKIILKLPGDIEWIHFYDAETGLKVKQIIPVLTTGGNFLQTIEFDDYQSVSGIKFPYKITQKLGLRKIDFEVVSIEINSGLEDSLFE